MGDYVLLGKTENVRRCAISIRDNQVVQSSAALQRFVKFAPTSSAPILTYTNDEPRLTGFATVLASLSGNPLSPERYATLKAAIKEAPFAATETTLTSAGIDRKTHSAFGQFSTLMSLLEPDQNAGPTH